ncbi:hypothetical protein [Acuticoccus mangrovi]|uniref:Uncharacterized protein n=1 Tax=Acuticoccus mangrovi TaxID=2796142 RepID=A0A934IP83_9HYPH|nr:hypothetical protein [Acuticoccus mangrovi]MBJ3775059.1 hypothetical protein [Acuticoccus mangrovi]
MLGLALPDDHDVLLRLIEYALAEAEHLNDGACAGFLAAALTTLSQSRRPDPALPCGLPWGGAPFPS